MELVADQSWNIKVEPSMDFLLILPTEQPLLIPKEENVTMKKPIFKLKKFDSKFINKARMFEKFLKCSNCDYVARYSFRVRKHLKICLEKKNIVKPLLKYRCDKCPYSAKYKSDIRSHMRTHLKIKPFKCEDCGKHFGTLREYRNHMKERNYLLRCKVCDVTFKCKILEQNHIREQHDNKYECEVCMEPCETRRQLYCHRKIHFKEKCEICNREFSCKTNLQNHQVLNNHGKFSLKSYEKRFSCNDCDKVYLMKQQLGQHKWKIHVNGKKLIKFECDLCDKTFNQKANLQTHLRGLHRNFEFYCTLCRARFLTVQGLFKHRKEHVGQPVFKCTECSYSTMKKINFHAHMRIHGYRQNRRN